MNFDDLERRLQKLPVRPLTQEKQEEIWSAIESATSSSPSRALPPRDGLHSRLRELFWPSPVAWATVVAVWMLSFGMLYAAKEQPSPILTKLQEIPPKILIALIEKQNSMFAGVQLSTEVYETPKTPAHPAPRSQRRAETVSV